MQTNFDNSENLTKYIAKLADPATSWEKEGINLSKLDHLIENNRRLILQQTENAETAPKLQKSLFDLSKRMETEVNTPEGRKLAFEVSTVALGIFPIGEGEKPDWTGLPQDVLKVIFSQNPPDGKSRKTGLENPSKVSTEWNENAEIVKKNWFEKGLISLKNYGCNSAMEAVQCVIDKKLSSADLSNFSNINDAELTKLIKSCPGLDHLLLLECEEISNFPLGELTNLKTLCLENCEEISEDVFLEELPQLRQLTSLNLKGCFQFTEIESIKDLSKINHLDLSLCKRIPENKLLESLKNLSQLTHLDLSYLPQISEDSLAEILKNLPHLKELYIYSCEQITKERIVEWRKQYPDIKFCN